MEKNTKGRGELNTSESPKQSAENYQVIAAIYAASTYATTARDETNKCIMSNMFRPVYERW